MAKRITDEDLELLAELGVETATETKGGRSPRQQRIIAGFEEIQRFFEQHGRLPQHGEDRDIFERLYAVRLDRIRESAECRELLTDFDTHGLLKSDSPKAPAFPDHEPSDEELLATLGVEAVPEADITNLVHVRPYAEIKAAEEIAKRTPCKNFDEFRPIFEAVQRELQSGERHTVKFGGYADIKKGDLFILEGQKLLIVDVGEIFTSEYERINRRLRVVYDNGTESEPLLRSLQRALYEDKSSRRITQPGFGPLFADIEEEGDLETGYIYVLRSKSDHPFVAEHREVLHKIGVTGGDVKTRVAGASKDPTYLLADVDIVATFKLANINRKKLEALLHKVFSSARLDLELKDRFGFEVEPREWFLVPLSVIDEAIEKIKDGTIEGLCYSRQSASLTPAQ